MSSVGSFGTFTTARLAIYTSQKGLSVTGNNIANINTIGYTRQRLDQTSFKTGGADRYQNSMDMRVGNGAMGKSVSQLRDPYLDIRYRTENSSLGYQTAMYSGLDQLQAILDEVGKGENKGDGLLYAQFSDFFDCLQQLKTDSGAQVNDTLVRSSADQLAILFHSAAEQLETLRTNTEAQLRQDIDDVNGILISIRDLNEAIRKSEVHGDNALELRDDRNLLIDQLSEYLNIDVTYSPEEIGAGLTVEKLTIRLGNANPDAEAEMQGDTAFLVDGLFAAQLTTPKLNEAYDPKFDPNSDEYDPNDPDVAAAQEGDLRAFLYVDENGAGTNDPRDAFQEFDSQYNITVSQLKDKNDYDWRDVTGPTSTKITNDAAFPTKSKYSANLTVTGQWKDGDTLSVGNQTVTIGPDGDLTAAQANDPKTLARAIRQALAKDPAFDGYEIVSRTTQGANGTVNILLTVTAQEAGATPVPQNVTFQANTAAYVAGTIGVGALTDVTDPDNPNAKKTYTAQITPGQDWNIGDEIKIGGNTVLTVGTNISLNSAKDPARLAAALARNLEVNGYTVTGDKDGNLVFTANDAATAAAPTLPGITVQAPAKGAITKTAEAGTVGSAGTPDADGKLPNEPTESYVDNKDGTISKVNKRYFQNGDDWYEVLTVTRTSKTITMDDNDLYGALQAVRELLTEDGEFASQADIDIDENAAIKRGIPYYQHSLDLLARQFAKTFNEANKGFAIDQNGLYLDKDGKAIQLGAQDETIAQGTAYADLTADQQAALQPRMVTDFIKANFGGVDKDGVTLLNQYGEPLTLGGEVLTTDQLTVNGAGWDAVLADAVGVNDKGEFVLADGTTVAVAEDGITANFTAEQTTALEKQAVNSYLTVEGQVIGGNLFSWRNDTDSDAGITASNISISQSWSNGSLHVVPTFTKLYGGEISNTTQSDNVRHMCTLMESKLVYNPQDLMEDAVSEHLFEGSFQEMLSKMSSVLGNDKRATNTAMNNSYNQVLDIDTSRDSVSAVDLNDEAMDLMKYSHSLNAAYRLMTTLDEALDRLITGTGVTR